jgi:hypothetical protein
MSENLKLDKFKSIFICEYCSSLINNPVILPCGKTVCKSHQAEIIQNNCKFCERKHSIENGQGKPSFYTLKINT